MVLKSRKTPHPDSARGSGHQLYSSLQHGFLLAGGVCLQSRDADQWPNSRQTERLQKDRFKELQSAWQALATADEDGRL
jgi:hypothetical protein